MADFILIIETGHFTNVHYQTLILYSIMNVVVATKILSIFTYDEYLSDCLIEFLN